MSRDGRGNSTQDVLRLVQVALDEFEDVPIAASVRRAVRIAVAVGETQTAVRLTLELRSVGGHLKSNRADIERLLGDEARPYSDPDGPIERAHSSYLGDRSIPNDPDRRVVAHSLDEIDFWLREMPSAQDAANDGLFREVLSSRQHMEAIVGITRNRAFTALCGWERQLTFAATNQSILSAHQARVDAALATSAPEVLDQFNVVFRRLDEAATAESGTLASELLSQAASSCRRILKSVVDLVQPVDPTQLKSDGGHVLNDGAYRNRLFEFLKSSTQSETAATALTEASTALWARFGAIDSLSSKGVHADVARDEAELCALNTYLMAGEILRIHDRGPSGSNGPAVDRAAAPL